MADVDSAAPRLPRSARANQLLASPTTKAATTEPRSGDLLQAWEVCRTFLAQSAVFTFEHRDRHFLFDGETLHLVEVSPVVRSLVDQLCETQSAELTEVAVHMGAEQVSRGLLALLELHDRGLFVTRNADILETE